MSMLVFGDSHTIASTALTKPFPESCLSFTLLVKPVEGAPAYLPTGLIQSSCRSWLTSNPSFSRQRFFDANAHSARAKFPPKSTDNLCHCWNSCCYSRDPLFPNVNELALAPCKLSPHFYQQSSENMLILSGPWS